MVGEADGTQERGAVYDDGDSHWRCLCCSFGDTIPGSQLVSDLNCLPSMATPGRSILTTPGTTIPLFCLVLSSQLPYQDRYPKQRISGVLGTLSGGLFVPEDATTGKASSISSVKVWNRSSFHMTWCLANLRFSPCLNHPVLSLQLTLDHLAPSTIAENSFEIRTGYVNTQLHQQSWRLNEQNTPPEYALLNKARTKLMTNVFDDLVLLIQYHGLPNLKKFDFTPITHPAGLHHQTIDNYLVYMAQALAEMGVETTLGRKVVTVRWVKGNGAV